MIMQLMGLSLFGAARSPWKLPPFAVSGVDFTDGIPMPQDITNPTVTDIMAIDLGY